jgi:DNA-binding Xre family transcriptional regulator
MITLTDDLTDLIRYQRKEVSRLTQKGAALAAGEMSEVWWQQIESGRAESVPADTLARMCYAIDVSPDQLRAIGQDRIARLVDRRRRLLEPESSAKSSSAMDDHLMRTPGLTQAQCIVLIELARGLLRAENDTAVTIAT